MHDFQRKFSMKNYRREIALKGGRRNARKSLSEGFRNTNDSWERLHKSDQNGDVSSTKEPLSKKKKRTCEAERKCRECNPKTNGPPAGSITLTCSTCNRQVRARIGLVGHQRTHQHTRTLLYMSL